MFIHNYYVETLNCALTVHCAYKVLVYHRSKLLIIHFETPSTTYMYIAGAKVCVIAANYGGITRKPRAFSRVITLLNAHISPKNACFTRKLARS